MKIFPHLSSIGLTKFIICSVSLLSPVLLYAANSDQVQQLVNCYQKAMLLIYNSWTANRSSASVDKYQNEIKAQIKICSEMPGYSDFKTKYVEPCRTNVFMRADNFCVAKCRTYSSPLIGYLSYIDCHQNAVYHYSECLNALAVDQKPTYSSTQWCKPLGTKYSVTLTASSAQ